ncbi:MAG: recombinase family protein, partial [Planctomycetota bacterium]
HKAETKLTPAVGYIRMSGDRQEKSPEQQKTDITKLATREGFAIVEWYTDEAISGDTTTVDRAGLAALLIAAKARKFKAVLAWHTNRISREDPMDAVVFYNQLRKAGVGLHTCCEGAIDLDSFTSQLLLFVNQKASNDFLVELSAKVVRGKIANAKRGGWNGGNAHYGLDRGLFDDDGQLVRRLQPGESVRMKRHHIRLLPTTDAAKIEAIRFAFNRMDTADIGARALAREIDRKGYPSPTGTGWTHKSVARMLTSRAYVGTSQWGVTAWGEYHEAQGEEIVAIKNGNGKAKGHSKPEEDVIAVLDAHEGIIDPKLFDRVQRKLKHPESPRATAPQRSFPLTDLIFCKHCGKKMIGETGRGRDRQGKLAYTYLRYVCSHYAKFGTDGQHNTTCGHHAVDAQRVLGWLVQALQETFLGPGRDELVQNITRQLKADTKASSGDVERLQKKAADLDREVGRLVRAIRTIDAAELVEELEIVRTERDRIRDELATAGSLTDPVDLHTEAERLADTMMDLGERLTDSDPAILRAVLRRFVSRIDCRWKRNPGRQRHRYELVEGMVELHEQTPFSVYGVVGHGS